MSIFTSRIGKSILLALGIFLCMSLPTATYAAESYSPLLRQYPFTLPALTQPTQPKNNQDSESQDVHLAWRRVNGIPVHVVTINLRAEGIRVAPLVAKDFPSRAESFHSMVKRTGAIAAINGTFFNKWSYFPAGDVLVNGKFKSVGRTVTALGFTYDRQAEFLTIQPGKLPGKRYQHLLSCGPRLLTDGQVILKPREEGFRDPNIYRPRNRSAVGLTQNGKLLFVIVERGIYLKQLAVIMKELGAIDAMNLDGGSSSALYFKDRMVRTPKSPLPNILVVQRVAPMGAPNFAQAMPKLELSDTGFFKLFSYLFDHLKSILG